MRNYQLNTAAAREAGARAFIEEKGAYVGVFTRAQAVTSKRGTEGIEFDFESKEHGTANYLAVWTHDKDGNELYGFKVLQGILTSLGQRNCAPVEATIEKRDPESRQMVKERVHVFPELMNKPIGVVLGREEYERNDGGTGWKNVLVCPFEAATRKLPGERLDNKPAEGLERLLRTLRDKPLRQQRSNSSGSSGNSSGGSGGGRQPAPAGSGFDDMDDDIPF